MTGSFEDNPQKILFWVIFALGTLISLLIILNMVIAVMSSAFEKVEEENEAHIIREKLSVILENWYRMDDSYKRDLVKDKYLILVEVDPIVDSVTEFSTDELIH